MSKEKPSALVQTIILATAVFNIGTAIVNLGVAGLKAVPAAAAAPPASVLATCPAAAAPAPQVIQYLNIAPPQPNEKEPSRPGGQ